MNALPTCTSLPLLIAILLFWPGLAPSQNPGAGAAVSSEAAAIQPRPTEKPPVPSPDNTSIRPAPVASPSAPEGIDPLLDPSRPRNCQLTVAQEQKVRCGEIEVVLPAGVYKQALLVENPEGRRAMDTTNLKRQQVGLGYIRYFSDVKLKVDGEERPGGIDIGIRKDDGLPVRIWYRKMTNPDDATKALAFLFPPAALVAGAGAWSSGNTLLPDVTPEFTEARDYFLKETPGVEVVEQPAVRLRPADPKNSPGLRANR